MENIDDTVEKYENIINYQVIPTLQEILRLKEYIDEETYSEIVKPLRNLIINTKQK